MNAPIEPAGSGNLLAVVVAHCIRAQSGEHLSPMHRALLSPLVPTIEILEGRIAPAAIMTFTDFDGDTVKITSSKGTLADLQAALNDFAGDGASLTLGAVFKGANISIIAGATDSDAALVNFSFINAAGIDLGALNIDGELNRIVAGDSNSKTPGLRSLSVGTFGVTDVTPGDAANQFDSNVTGALSSLSVSGDMKGAYLQVLGSDFGAPGDETGFDGKIGSLFIGGSLLGTARENGGAIFASGNIGNVKVVGNITGLTGANARVADGQDHNASIIADGEIGVITIGGNLTGGDGDFSGHITSGLGIRALNVKNLIGGYGDESGVVGSSGTLGRVDVEESVIGGAGYRSGSILSLSNMQAVHVGLKLEGGGGESSGWIAAGGTITSVNIGQDLPAGSDAIIGGSGQFSGSVGARGSVGAVHVFGDVVGGSGPSSGQIVSSGKIASVTLEGDLVGGSDFETGSIGSLLGLGPILIKGSILAGTGERSALITTQKAFYGEGEEFIAAPIASVTVLGSIDASSQIAGIAGAELGIAAGGPAGEFSAGILASGNLGPVIVKGHVRGGEGDSSGRIASTNAIKSVTIEGNLIGGDGGSSGAITASGALGPVSVGAKTLGNVAGGVGDFSGVIFSATKIAKVTIGGNLFGGSGFESGVIETSNEGSNAADIGAIFIGGSIVGGDRGSRSGSIFSDGKIASVTVGDPKAPVETEVGVGPVLIAQEISGNGSVIGGFAYQSGSIFSQDDLGPVKIKFNLIGGNGEHSGRIFSGGKITSLAVGVATEGSIIGGFGDQTDINEGDESGQVFARESIAKVEIGGNLGGGQGDYTAQIRGASIGSVRVIEGSISGGTGFGSGSIVAYIGDIGSVKVDDSISAGNGQDTGWIAAEGSIGSVVTHFLSGNNTSRARISAVEKITSVTIGDSASFADIFAGYNIDGNAVNGDAQIGMVKVTGYHENGEFFGGNIRAVNIVAGVVPGFFGTFGTPDNTAISNGSSTPNLYSKIASIIIAGDVLQAPSPGVPLGAEGGLPGFPAHFGIVAQHVVSIKVGGEALDLKAGPVNDPLSPPRLVGTATDTTYGEVISSVGNP